MGKKEWMQFNSEIVTLVETIQQKKLLFRSWHSFYFSSNSDRNFFQVKISKWNYSIETIQVKLFKWIFSIETLPGETLQVHLVQQDNDTTGKVGIIHNIFHLLSNVICKLFSHIILLMMNMSFSTQHPCPVCRRRGWFWGDDRTHWFQKYMIFLREAIKNYLAFFFR